MRRHWLKVILGVLGLAALAAWFLSRRTEGVVWGLVPLSDDEALVLTGGPGETAGVTRVRADGTVLWSRELPAGSNVDGARHGVAVGAGLVSVQLVARGHRAGLVALGLADGEIRWRSEPASATFGDLVAGPRVVGELLVEPAGAEAAGEGWVLEGRGLATGALAWTERLSGAVTRMDAGPGWLALQTTALTAFDLTGDAPQRLSMGPATSTCVVKDQVLALHGGALVRTSLSAPGSAPQALGQPGLGNLDTCGLHAGDLLLTGDGPPTEPESGLVVVRLNAESGSHRWRLAFLGWRLARLGGTLDRDEEAYHPLRGDLARAVPLILAPIGPGRTGHKLVMVNLAEGRILWESTERDDLVRYQILRGPSGIHYLDGRGHVAAFDGTSGLLLGAVRGPLEWLRGSYATANRLWTFTRSTPAAPNALPWHVLDVRTLKLFHSGQEPPPDLRDDLAATAVWIAIPPDSR